MAEQEVKSWFDYCTQKAAGIVWIPAAMNINHPLDRSPKLVNDHSLKAPEDIVPVQIERREHDKHPTPRAYLPEGFRIHDRPKPL